ETLLRIDSADTELLVAQAEANLLVAKANLELREAESQAARENWTLLHDGDVPDLVAKLPQINQAKANVAVANAQLSAAKLDLARTEFSLPFDGRVLSSQIGVGQWVSKGQAFGTSFDLSSLEVEVPISGTELNLLSPVTERDALVFVNGLEIPATVDRMSASADLRSRASSLYLVFPMLSTPLVPGNFVSVKVFGREQSNVYRIPDIAEQANSTLWIVRDGLLERITPQIIERSDEELTIIAFDYGDGIVIGSLVGVYPGQKVAIASE
ncbi:MAG: efflux RND transporter periplasmic adaptor subunit, partial [Gammaproteobacteria bacterium]|nr:efflux RND transporter periplasmic adaptor subunit [Gammaproteobacteria bacterium]